MAKYRIPGTKVVAPDCFAVYPGRVGVDIEPRKSRIRRPDGVQESTDLIGVARAGARGETSIKIVLRAVWGGGLRGRRDVLFIDDKRTWHGQGVGKKEVNVTGV